MTPIYSNAKSKWKPNIVLFYFAASPFFDATSNNASLAIQASYNDNFRPFIETRDAFEGRLKTMQGLEFMVAHDPLQQHQALQCRIVSRWALVFHSQGEDAVLEFHVRR